MKKLFTSTLLAVVAVPFLIAAPSAAKKVQNQPASTAPTSTANDTKAKKHTKKSKKSDTATTNSGTAAPSSTPQK